MVALFFRTAGEPVVFPVGPLLLASAAVTVMVLLVTAVAFAVGAGDAPPELLRSD
ncbi:MAG: hypothetical protein H0V07_07880 [Propionibacteriales bacterium]|nr:hypothetical protein [Propionibacteriales bacterium]